ncbi:MFS transporter [Solicola gregarius]|uniref:MFS transporter n=1 Tax=Solicola gregarius TaxID=2908642 RepID=A0AA46YJI4_9ACTN|nr:MFS transporter [Solicola gregarius]UYM03521.1 MFS transporter [Solicola gregarius]
MTTAISAWRRVRIWAVAHAIDDFYQGLVPAMLPYFILDRNYSYVAASALAMAANLGSSLPQPFLGVVADRRNALWMAPIGLAIAGAAAGLSGTVPAYAIVWALLLASGIGVAMFHPAAGKDARAEAGESATAMSLFAAGGSVGFFLAPALATPLFVEFGVRASVVFVPPALVMALVLARHQRRRSQAAKAAVERTGRDRWGPFALVTGVGVVRSIVSFGVMTFVAMYWIEQLDSSPGMGGVALTCFLIGGVVGTIAGGRIGDRFGVVRAAQWGSIAMVPALIAVRLVGDPYVALPLIALAGVATNIPFAVLVKLGQDYLPSRPGTAAGITLGLAVSAGGLLVPVLGAVADWRGPEAVLTVLCLVPVAAIALSAFLPSPVRERATVR